LPRGASLKYLFKEMVFHRLAWLLIVGVSCFFIGHIWAHTIIKNHNTVIVNRINVPGPVKYQDRVVYTAEPIKSAQLDKFRSLYGNVLGLRNCCKKSIKI
jgi:hypothetical protein